MYNERTRGGQDKRRGEKDKEEMRGRTLKEWRCRGEMIR
jgi:hypothetical protein